MATTAHPPSTATGRLGGTEQMRFIVQQAVLAPSSHNTQPWRFGIDGERLELRVDRNRALPVNDPRDRELTISCGAALFNARVAAARIGRGLELTLLPDGDGSDVLARAALTDHVTDEAGLFAAIAERHTYRGAFIERALERHVVSALAAAAAAEGARLERLDGEQRGAYIDLVARGDRVQFADPRWRRELAAWMRPRRKGDGLAYSELAAPLMRFVVAHFDVGKRSADKDVALAQRAPLIAVLTSDGDSPMDWLHAGQALEHVLLVAASHGVQASYLNQPLQVGNLRGRVAELLGGCAFPQATLRLGRRTGRPPVARRRPVDDVIGAEPRR
jgi:nitroreductase